MPYNFVAAGFHTKKLFSYFLLTKCDFTWKMAVFEPPWGLGAMYDVHLRLIGKLIVDFLLVIIELFSLGVMAEALQVNMD